MRRQLLLSMSLLFWALWPCGEAAAIAIAPPFDTSYTFTDLGSVPQLPTPYGGLTFLSGNPNELLIGGTANTAEGRLYTIGVTRGADNHITGFTGTAAQFGNVGTYNDGGVVYGPDGVLFTTQYPVNKLGQTKPGSTVEDRVDNLTSQGVASSVGAVNFVPSGFAGAGQMKVVSYNSGGWYTIPFSPDGSGTFNLGLATLGPTLTGGPEGFVYISSANPDFLVDSLLVSEYGADRVSAYAIDSNGDPIVATRQNFITGLTGAEGAVIDPLTGDFLFSTFGAANHVIVVQGFVAPPPPGGVPEPATIALVGFGLASIGFQRWRRRQTT